MKFLTAMACVFALAACSSGENSDQPDTPAAAEQRPPTVGKEIADNFNDSMDRAKNVEAQAMEQKQKIDEALKDAEADPNRR
jgi:beta-glucanase (GH16 family)